MVSNYTHGVDLKLLDIDNYATSLGLPFTPDVPVIQNEKMKEDLREKKNVNRFVSVNIFLDLSEFYA